MKTTDSLQIDPEGIETKQLLEFAQLRGSRKPRCLEVGCGDGRLTWRFAGACGAVTGIDVDADELRLALIDCPANLRETVAFARADSVRLPFRSSSFDLAIFAWSF